MLPSLHCGAALAAIFGLLLARYRSVRKAFVALAPALLACVATVGTLGVDAFDTSLAIDDSLVGPHYYYNVTIPANYLTGPDADNRFTFSINSQSPLLDVGSLESIALMDDVPTVAAMGEANAYIDLVAVPEPAGLLLAVTGLLIGLQCVRHSR
jgi:hypothetical protein